ncbi:MAG: hydroxypyruvate isomerase [Motiliproteus sp.]|jgi:hydroxypyruvate isomerase
MPRFCANLSLLFTELPWQERFQAAAAANFGAVEIQFPYHLAQDDLLRLLQESRQQLVLLNMPAGDWDAGERGIACLPDREQEFRQGIEQALDYALACNCQQINCLAGIRPPELPLAEALQLMSCRVAYAAKRLARYGISLNIEAINSIELPGFLLDRSALVTEMIRTLGCDNIRFQYDIYHMQRMEPPLLPRLASLLPYIGHIQIADHPGRHEPGSGDIDFPRLFKTLDTLGYPGWIALEYHPETTTQAGLSWLEMM